MALRCVQLCNENYVNGVEQQLHQLGGIGGDNTHAGTAVAAIAVDPHRRYVAAHNGMNGVNVYLLQDVLDPLRRRTRPCDDQAVHTELVPYQQIHTDAPVVALAFAGGECSSRPIAAAPKRYRLHNYRRKTVLVVCTRNTVRLYDVSEMDYSGVGVYVRALVCTPHLSAQAHCTVKCQWRWPYVRAITCSLLWPTTTAACTYTT
jgi:hypothetical protein